MQHIISKISFQLLTVLRMVKGYDRQDMRLLNKCFRRMTQVLFKNLETLILKMHFDHFVPRWNASSPFVYWEKHTFHGILKFAF